MKWAPLLVGGLAGAVLAFAVWKFAEKKLDAEFGAQGAKLLQQGSRALQAGIASAVATQVPPKVQQAIEEKFRAYGLTPTTGAQISRVLAAADRVGII